MSNKHFAVLLFFGAIFFSAPAQMVEHDVSALAVYPHYIINDNTALRRDSAEGAPLVKTLPIGTVCYLLDVAGDTVTVNGVQSRWYKSRVDGYTGWVWGGNIAKYVFGSNTEPDVKFLLGYGAHEQRKDGTGNLYITQVVQVKAVRNNKLLDKVTIPMWPFYFDATLYGNSGLTNVKDILSVHTPCVGGCGCSTGNDYLFWDGKKLYNAIGAWGTADADFSIWSSVVFPSDAGGESGYIIKMDDDVVDDREVGHYPYPKRIIKRQLTTTYYKWDGAKLEIAKEKPTTQKIYYVDSETMKETLTKPKQWDDVVQEYRD